MKRLSIPAGLLLVATTTVLSLLKPAVAEDTAVVNDKSADVVILLHGLARSERAMRPMAEYLADEGYQVINEGYPSRSYPLAELASDHLAPQVRRAEDQVSVTGGKVHFVTHSMGGILVRQYLSEKPMPQLGRIVMLAPPNQGSELANDLRNSWWFKQWNGPAGSELNTDETSVPLNLPDATGYELGVIAGNKSILPFFSDDLPGEDDGIVSVESTKLNGMKAHLVVPHTHTFIMSSGLVMHEVSHFLSDGAFSSSEAIYPNKSEPE